MANLAENPFFVIGRKFLTIKAEPSANLLNIAYPDHAYRQQKSQQRLSPIYSSQDETWKETYGSHNPIWNLQAARLAEDISLRIDSIDQITYNDQPISLQQNSFGQQNSNTGRVIKIYQDRSDIEPWLVLYFPDSWPQSAEAYFLLKNELMNAC